ncbi:uncharacterized protein LOC141853281 [Brevipalpus obovatus]|uniref:uncharacterized protein LOC141853281 n=1 Tax=Brevipalpus obovatus TaxID=246614 RepID=UPI003D9F35A4
MKFICFGIIFVIIALVSADAVKRPSDEECGQQLNKITQYNKIMYQLDFEKFPDTLQGIDYVCETGRKEYDQIHQYRKCLSGLGRQTAVLIGRGMKKLYRKFCTSKEKKEKLLEELRCYTSDTKERWTKCIIDIDRHLEFAVRNSTEKYLLANMCCSHATSVRCIENSMKILEKCPKKPVKKRFLMEALNTVVEESLDFVCGSFQHERECLEKNPQGVRNIEEISRSGTKELDSGKLLFGPLIAGVSRLSSDDTKDSDD